MSRSRDAWQTSIPQAKISAGAGNIHPVSMPATTALECIIYPFHIQRVGQLGRMPPPRHSLSHQHVYTVWQSTAVRLDEFHDWSPSRKETILGRKQGGGGGQLFGVTDDDRLALKRARGPHQRSITGCVMERHAACMSAGNGTEIAFPAAPCLFSILFTGPPFFYPRLCPSLRFIHL